MQNTMQWMSNVPDRVKQSVPPIGNMASPIGNLPSPSMFKKSHPGLADDIAQAISDAVQMNMEVIIHQVRAVMRQELRGGYRSEVGSGFGGDDVLEMTAATSKPGRRADGYTAIPQAIIVSSPSVQKKMPRIGHYRTYRRQQSGSPPKHPLAANQGQSGFFSQPSDGAGMAVSQPPSPSGTQSFALQLDGMGAEASIVSAAPGPVPLSPRLRPGATGGRRASFGSVVTVPFTKGSGTNSSLATMTVDLEQLMSMEFSVDLDELEQHDQHCSCRKTANRWVKQSKFVTITDFGILFSAMLTGLHVELMASNSLVEHGVIATGMESLRVFLVFFFVLEAALLITAQGTLFFCGPAWKWNAFDLLITGIQLASLFIRHESSTIGLLRLSRFFRTSRRGSLSAWTWELRMLLTSIVGSMKTLGWSLLVLFVFTYMFSVYLTEIVLNYQTTNPESLETESNEVLEELYGTVPAAMMTLFQTISDGIHWHEVMTPLTSTISPWLSLGFVVYISIAAFVFVNIIAGVVFDSATTTARQDKKAAILEDIKKAFEVLDKEGTGRITRETFTKEVANNSLMDIHFRALGVAPDQAHELFNLLDNDESGFIDRDEFVEGIHRLQGDVKAIDFASFVNEWRCFCYRVDEHLTFVERSWTETVTPHNELKRSRVQFNHTQMEEPAVGLTTASWALSDAAE
mmetsp:Transcript_2553/g.6477  ORF Transcript_2553/g.6477 Transcript_2553/m.6477 type:complete len:687 (-) Transcript_2553:66-2126(-)